MSKVITPRIGRVGKDIGEIRSDLKVATYVPTERVLRLNVVKNVDRGSRWTDKEKDTGKRTKSMESMVRG